MLEGIGFSPKLKTWRATHLSALSSSVEKLAESLVEGEWKIETLEIREGRGGKKLSSGNNSSSARKRNDSSRDRQLFAKSSVKRGVIVNAREGSAAPEGWRRTRLGGHVECL